MGPSVPPVPLSRIAVTRELKYRARGGKLAANSDSSAWRPTTVWYDGGSGPPPEPAAGMTTWPEWGPDESSTSVDVRRAPARARLRLWSRSWAVVVAGPSVRRAAREASVSSMAGPSSRKEGLDS